MSFDTVISVGQVDFKSLQYVVSDCSLLHISHQTERRLWYH